MSSSPLEVANQRLDELKKEVSRLERFIEMYVELGGDAEVSVKTTTRKRNPTSPHVVADVIETLILHVGHPLTRGELAERLADTEVELSSKDKSKYIGTILWRNADRFLRVAGQGYWLKGKPLPEIATGCKTS